ncbi:GNAT family N-acetyltransferase [Sulfitobacter albidus]|uniref:GNAT family N-acetyltransferase n=1 Tax=Sulfitobacter albidus TaxID=2829501 RepID=A0A975JFE1_9RHOB|nr:GNAT family N-acetyltransferase [Sulfitobacter albidus]QUJ77201.1 GNAT family N-acetyltransferase [Sulfitobacter albidus]
MAALLDPARNDRISRGASPHRSRHDRPEIQIQSPPDKATADALHQRLREAGQTATQEELVEFLLSIHNDAGALIAGCKGELCFGAAHISELWVDAALRGQGTGRRLLMQAEDHACSEGCTRIHIETRAEGARRLYEACGYRVFGQLPRYKGEDTLYYLEKSLT